ncbi:transcriptional repressor LexA [Isachenkonia alkalipeptolytica]|uniref:LexA repressor n=1 Tax=Isachenkonia alkalipeptolytica TaxID=2565777 RepID=A0AA43XMM2_9CLOT|nr:transcriptional repressor LexA [Isachenkonia alkalipeptolytica]NBG88745.1 transcriptional repressor LexA [Isachenkonia alkalipeptolytica]
MYEDLNSSQIKILNYLKYQLQNKGYPPSVREICHAVELKSTSTVHAHLAKLEKKGYIRKDPTKPRAIEILHSDSNLDFKLQKEIINVPVIGKVTAGEPILAVENIEDTFPLPVDFVDSKNHEIFILKIKGDSMVDAGIFDGDFIVVSQQSTANNGDIVVALIEEEATVKRFYKEQDQIRLQPENKNMDPIYTSEATILGLVVGVYRKTV